MLTRTTLVGGLGLLACQSLPQPSLQDSLRHLQKASFLSDEIFASPCEISLNTTELFSEAPVRQRLQKHCFQILQKELLAYINRFQQKQRLKNVSWLQQIPQPTSVSSFALLNGLPPPRIIYEKHTLGWDALKSTSVKKILAVAAFISPTLARQIHEAAQP